MNDFDKLAEKFGTTPDLARHLIACDKCDPTGDEWQQYYCNIYRMLEGTLHYGCQTKEQHESAERMRAIYRPMLEEMLRPSKFLRHRVTEFTPSEPGKTVTFQFVDDPSQQEAP